MTMVRSIWKGSLSFGLVNVPVKLVSAVRQKDVRFHMLHDADGARIEQKRVCSADGEEVPYEHVVKGYEVSKDEYVVLTKEDMEAVDPEKTETIDIQDFVDVYQIDPIYFEKPYYLVPEKGAAKAYRLLLQAMADTQKVAIARVVMRSKEHLVAVRPVGNVLAMTTLLYHDELVDQADLEVPETGAAPSEKELAMAQQLIDALSTDFDPEKYHDEYRERLMQLIETKAEGKEIVAPPRKEPARTKDLADALAASLEAAKQRRRQEAEA
jgi:DNA end-binding protein Ku